MAAYVGIDVHKHYCQAALMNDTGHILKELRFDNNSEGATSLLTLAKSVDPQIRAVVEPSANFWIRIYDKLEQERVDVKLSNPLRTKAIAEARIKTDQIDAETLAYLLRGDLVAESYVPSRKNRERRALIRHRASLMRIRVDLKNRIHALLDKHELSYTYSDLFGKEGLEWLRSLQLPTPDQQILQSNIQDEKLVSCVGLAPQTHQSGETQWTDTSPGKAASELVGFSANAPNPLGSMILGCESSTNASKGSMDTRKQLLQ